MSEFNKLRMELKTDIELIALRQEQMAKTMDTWSSSFEQQGHQVAAQGKQIAEHAEQIAEQGRRIAEQGQRIAEMAQHMNAHHQETARLGREVADGQRWTQGRLRLLVERLERRDQPPAA